MKKILFALVAIALVVVSCKPKTDDSKKEAFNIKMSVAGSPTATGADVLCVPNYDTCYYMAFYAPTASMSQVTAKEISEYANQTISAAATYGYDCATLATMGYVLVGENTASYSDLDAETSYTAIAVQVDDKVTVYETMFTCEFTTAVMPTSSMNITIAYVDSVVNFTPAGTDSYGCYVEVKDSFLAYYDELNADNIAEELEAWAYTYSYYGYTWPLYNAATSISMSFCASSKAAIPAGTEFVAFAAPMVGTTVNGPANYIQFQSTREIPKYESTSAPAKIRR